MFYFHVKHEIWLPGENFRMNGATDINDEIDKSADFCYLTTYIRDEAIRHIRWLCVQMQKNPGILALHIAM